MINDNQKCKHRLIAKKNWKTQFTPFKADHKHAHKNLELYEVWINMRNMRKLLSDDPLLCTSRNPSNPKMVFCDVINY